MSREIRLDHLTKTFLRQKTAEYLNWILPPVASSGRGLTTMQLTRRQPGAPRLLVLTFGALLLCTDRTVLASLLTQFSLQLAH